MRVWLLVALCVVVVAMLEAEKPGENIFRLTMYHQRPLSQWAIKLKKVQAKKTREIK